METATATPQPPDEARLVLEVDQWTSTALHGKPWNELVDAKPETEPGTDAHTVVRLGIATYTLKRVDVRDRPQLGRVWFVSGPDGNAEVFKSNYDSSD